MPPDVPPFTFIPTPVLIAAIVVSAIVCFLLARHLSAPLKRVREASERLAAGDLTARAGAMVQGRRDEIGDLVRDFDVMAGRLSLLVSSQKQLLSDISHELRSPLARLHVAVELARRKAGPAAEKDLNRIEAEGTRMNEMIGQILTLARADSDKPAVTELFDVADLVRRVAADTDYEARQSGRTVVVRDSAEAMVQGDAALVASAIENVVRNGSRYTPEGTSVDISVATTATRAHIIVRDHGPGVPPEEIDRIFLPFHRVGASRDRNSGGTGLGLSIAARAASVHGGTIRARNADGGGLEVAIDLPLYKALHSVAVS
jgi:two-component system sensor histidine kinase CpxA